MARTEELYNQIPEGFRKIFEMKGESYGEMKTEEDIQEELKTPFGVLQETLEKIQAINKR